MSLPFLQPYFGLSNSLQTAQASAGGGGVGGWVELGRTTLGSAGDTISVASLANKRYYMVLSDTVETGGAARPNIRMGAGAVDTGSNYATRRNENGGTESTNTSLDFINTTNLSPYSKTLQVGYISNYSTKEKLYIGHTIHQNTAGAATAPKRTESVGKWANTSSALDVITTYNDDAGSFDTGSEMVVLGWDPADTHTTNFWTELGSDTLVSSSDKLTITFTAKKYLWVQGWITPTGGNARPNIRMGAGSEDTGSNYANRRSENGAADALNTSLDFINTHNFGVATPQFFNFFVVNNSANEKLVTGHLINQSTAGAGTAPGRAEFVGKWANTSAQADRIIIYNDEAGSFNTGSTVRVWGSN